MSIKKIRSLMESMSKELDKLEQPETSTGGYKVSVNGRKEITVHEGVRYKPYKDAVGYWTAGVGHLITKSRKLPAEWKRRLTKAEVDKLLQKDLTRFEDCVNSACPNGLTQNRFDAMVSLAFNIGEGAFKRSSICRRHNAGDFQGAANAFLLYRKAGGRVLQGLVNRRKKERALYLS